MVRFLFPPRIPPETCVFRLWSQPDETRLSLEPRDLRSDSEEWNGWTWRHRVQEVEDPPRPHDAA
jgi:hypothetical protein